MVTPIPQTSPPLSQEPQKISPSTIVLSIILVVVIISTLIILIFFDQLASQPTIQNLIKGIPNRSKTNIILPATPPSPTPKPTPSFLHPGKETYSIDQHPSGSLPSIQTLIVNPLDIKQGDEQSIDVVTSSPLPMVGVTITLYADDKQKQTHALTQISSDGTTTRWQGKWTIQYTQWYRYVFVISAINKAGEYKAYVAPRTIGPILKSDLD